MCVCVEIEIETDRQTDRQRAHAQNGGRVQFDTHACGEEGKGARYSRHTHAQTHTCADTHICRHTHIQTRIADTHMRRGGEGE